MVKYWVLFGLKRTFFSTDTKKKKRKSSKLIIIFCPNICILTINCDHNNGILFPVASSQVILLVVILSWIRNIQYYKWVLIFGKTKSIGNFLIIFCPLTIFYMQKIYFNIYIWPFRTLFEKILQKITKLQVHIGFNRG